MLHEYINLHTENVEFYLKRNELELKFINKTNSKAIPFHIKSELENFLEKIDMGKVFTTKKCKLHWKRIQIFSYV